MMSLALRASEEVVLAPRQNGNYMVYVRGSDPSVVSCDFSTAEMLPAGAVRLESFLDEFDAHPSIAANLAGARTEFSTLLQNLHGVTIRSLRLARSLTQADLAQKIGTSQAAVSAIENRSREPGEATIRALRDALEVDFDTLMAALSNG